MSDERTAPPNLAADHAGGDEDEKVRAAWRSLGVTGARVRAVLLPIASFVVLLLVWHVGARAIGIRALFPTPIDVLAEARRLIQSGDLLTHIVASMTRIIAGFALGSAIAVPTGLLMGSLPLVRSMLQAYIEFFRYIPALSLVTLAMIWFGIGEASKVFLITYVTVFIVTINTMAGVAAIPVAKLRAGRSLGATPRQMFVHVTLPASVPFILTGMRLAMGAAFTTIVAAEMVAAQSGLGFLIFSSRLYMQTDAIFVAIVTLGLLGFVTDGVLRWVMSMVAGRYAPPL
ncbi:MAG TPA: ABC transporter permease [Candidatus Methylomirabilis sp.]|nr:ABC transporter permease [Candidatus Methylomirabilis sp.]